MTPERWARVKQLFSIAVDRGPDMDPAALRDLCGGDRGLSDDLAALVQEHFRLETQAGSVGTSPAPPPDVATYAHRRFRFLARIGAGSFGDVYKVHDEQRGTTVALKVLRETKP